MRQQSGYIALLAVLIMGAASTAIAVTLLFTGIDSQRGALVSLQSVQARNLATTCAEEALQQIYDDAGYIGTNNLSLGQGSCTYTVVDSGGDNRTITASGTIGAVVRRVSVEATIGATEISIISWQDTT